jgi:hypothetical protein
VGPADASSIEHGDDIAGHVGYGKQSGRPVAAPAPPVVRQHKPEVAPQFPLHRLPPGPVETHPLDQNQPWPPPVHSSAQLVSDPQLTVKGVPGPAHLACSGQAGEPVLLPVKTQGSPPARPGSMAAAKERLVRIVSIC